MSSITAAETTWFEPEKIIDNNITLQEASLQRQFLETLTPMEKLAIKIAKSHLETSFTLYKSNAYIKWKKTLH